MYQQRESAHRLVSTSLALVAFSYLPTAHAYCYDQYGYQYNCGISSGAIWAIAVGIFLIIFAIGSWTGYRRRARIRQANMAYITNARQGPQGPVQQPQQASFWNFRSQPQPQPAPPYQAAGSPYQFPQPYIPSEQQPGTGESAKYPPPPHPPSGEQSGSYGSPQYPPPTYAPPPV